MKVRTRLLGLVALGLASCASYAPKPLPNQVQYTDLSTLSVHPEQLPFYRLRQHPFNPADGFDLQEIAMLAIVNNPQLRQARDDLGIARAQAFAAGLLPDPQIGISGDHPTNGTIGTTNAFGLNLGYDLSALMLRASRVKAANAEQQRVQLELLWQEWQVASKAKLLFTQLVSQQQLLSQLQPFRDLLSRRYHYAQAALKNGNITLDMASADLIALQDAERQLNELQRAYLQNRIQLNQLLGFAATARLRLVGPTGLPELDLTKVRHQLAQRLAQRPDLFALRTAYQAQEARLRGAVLAQFPALNLGITRARDTGGVYTLGFGLNFTLPVLNANRGNIAIEKATRKKLYDTYQDRLNTAYRDVDTALENIPLLQTQYSKTRQGLGVLQTLVKRAALAYRAGNLSAPEYVRLQSTRLNKQLEAIHLRTALQEQWLALEMLLGPNLPLDTTGTTHE